MRAETRNYREPAWWRSELGYYGVLGGLALMLPLSLTTLLWLMPTSYAADNWEVEGANGTLYMWGALTDVDNPQLVKARGVSGLGLRLRDEQGRDMHFGARGQPQWLTPGQNALRYTVVPERTAAPLSAGAYRAIVDFKLSYE
ncbi:fimbrial protein [Serratia nevei]|uniref:fimbrial protein n=1 Tax=Serratia nevei TaxID=2703794 RepID=UPI003FA79A5B